MSARDPPFLARSPLANLGNPDATIAGSSTANLTIMIDVGPEGRRRSQMPARRRRDSSRSPRFVPLALGPHWRITSGPRQCQRGRRLALTQPRPAREHAMAPQPTRCLRRSLRGGDLRNCPRFGWNNGAQGRNRWRYSEERRRRSARCSLATVLWPRVRDTTSGEANAQSLALHLNVSGGVLVLSDLTAESQGRLARIPG